jgi:hypothetical protein
VPNSAKPDDSSSAFDAYYELLGIPPAEQPPTHYRLLGLSPLESNSKVIERATDRQMNHLRSFKTGEASIASQRLLNELAKASRILLNPPEKASYDDSLRKLATPLPAQQPQVAKSLPPMPLPLPPAAQTIPDFPPQFNTPTQFVQLKPQVAARPSPSRSVPIVIGGIVVSAVILLFSVVLVWSRSSGPAIVEGQNKPSGRKLIEVSPASPSTLPKIDKLATQPSSGGQPDRRIASPVPPSTAPVGVQPAILSDSPAKESLATVLPKDQIPTLETAEENVEVDPALVRGEIEPAKRLLREHPKLAANYKLLASKPDSLAEDGGKLATLIWQETLSNPVIVGHPPSFAAAMEEVERLSLAGGDFKLALQAIDSRRNLGAAGLSDTEADQAKAAALAQVAKVAGGPRGSADRRAEVKSWLIDAIYQATATGDETTLTKVLPALGDVSRTTAERFDTTTKLIPLIDGALVSNQPQLVGPLLERSDLLLKSAVGKGRKEVVDRLEPLRDRYALAKKAGEVKERLQVDSEDPAANLTYGLYLLELGQQTPECFGYLAKGSDAVVTELAAAELKPSMSAREKAALADRWAAAGEKRPALLHPARRLYAEALKGEELSGVVRAAVEDKASKLGSEASTASQNSSATAAKNLPRGKWVDLCPMVRLPDDALAGTWSAKDNGFAAEGNAMAKLRLPVDLAGASYDLQVEFTSETDPENVNVVLPVGDHSILLVGDGYVNLGTHSYFSLVSGKEPHQLPGSIQGPLLTAGNRYTYDISVRILGDQAKLALSLNGKPTYSYEGPTSDLQAVHAYRLPDDGWPGLTSWFSPINYLGCKVRLQQGTGTLLRVDGQSPSLSFSAGDSKTWTNGAVLAMSFDKPTLTSANGRDFVRDLSGHKNHGSIHGGALSSPGHSGLAMRFANSDDYVDCVDAENLNPTTSLSMAVWLQVDKWADDPAHGSIFSKDEWAGGGASGYVLRCGGNGIVDATICSSGWEQASARPGLKAGEWNHVVATFDSGQLRVYLNGEPQARSRTGSEIRSSKTPLRLGSGTFARERNLVGSIDEAAIWNRALTSEEVRSLFVFSKNGRSYCTEIAKAAKK